MSKSKASSKVAVEPSEVTLGSHVHIFGEFPPPAEGSDTEIVVEVIYETEVLRYELGPAHFGGELDVLVGTLEAGAAIARAFSVEFSGEGDERVAGARTPLGSAGFSVVE